MSSSAELTVTIDTAGVADVPALSLLSIACAVDNHARFAAPDHLAPYIDSQHSRRFFAERLADRRCIIRLARLPSGMPIGYMMIDTAELRVTDDLQELELKRLHILPHFRGRRIGARLFALAFEDARALGARRIVIPCAPDDHGSRRFYEAQGFAFAGERSVKMGAVRYSTLLFSRALD